MSRLGSASHSRVTKSNLHRGFAAQVGPAPLTSPRTLSSLISRPCLTVVRIDDFYPHQVPSLRACSFNFAEQEIHLAGQNVFSRFRNLSCRNCGRPCPEPLRSEGFGPAVATGRRLSNRRQVRP